MDDQNETMKFRNDKSELRRGSEMKFPTGVLFVGHHSGMHSEQLIKSV